MPLSNQHASGVTMKVFAEVKKVTTVNFSGRWKPQKVWMSWVQSGSRGLHEWDTVVTDQNIYRKQLLMLLMLVGGTERGRFVKPRLKLRRAKLPALPVTRHLNKAPCFPNVGAAVCPYSLMAWHSPHRCSVQALHLSQVCPAHGDSLLECFWCSSLL